MYTYFLFMDSIPVMVDWQVLTDGHLGQAPDRGEDVRTHEHPPNLNNLVERWMLEKNGLSGGAAAVAEKQGGVQVRHVMATVRI